MSLPEDIELMALDYVLNQVNLALVCKSWNAELKRNKYRAAKKILRWWQKRRVSENDEYNKLMRLKFKKYRMEWIINHPEFTINKLRLEDSLLDGLPPIDVRKPSDVRRWYFSMKGTISYEDWMYVGW